MRIDDVEELHYISPVANVRSILHRGILSHRRSQRLPHTTVAAEEIQERRRAKRVPGGRLLHEYVNLYLNGRNVMMYRVLREHADIQVVLLGIDPAVIQLPDVVISSCNASSDYARFDTPAEGLTQIDRERLFAEYWTHGDDLIETIRHRSEMCAEVLVPDAVDAMHVRRIYVPDDGIGAAAAAVCAGRDVVVRPYLFFR